MLIRSMRAVLLGALSTCLLCATAQAASSNLIPLKDFSRRPALSNPTMSPNGKYLAVRVDDEDAAHHSVVVYRIKGMKVTSILKMPKYQIPANITWVSSTRLVLSKSKAVGSLSIPSGTGEIISTRFDGTHQKYLYGNNAKGRRAVTRQDEGYASIGWTPRTPNGHFYMYVYPWGSEHVSQIYNVGADHNTRHLVSDIQSSGMSFLINKKGNATYAYGINADQEFHAFRNDGDRWQAMSSKLTKEHFMPFAYTPDEKKMFVWSSLNGGPYSLVKTNADASHPQTLMSDPFSNFTNMQWSPRPYKLLAVTKSTGIPKPLFINPNLPSAKLYKALEKAFPGQFVDFINFSQDGTELLFSTRSDRNPGTFYLLDRHNNKVSKLFDAAPWFKPAQMSKRLPFHFTASDGKKLEGILTLPRNRRKKNLPLVLLPHGGPYFVDDNWFFDEDAQMLASRGYLVLQVNFRGSSGRGPAFQQSGYLKWGTRIQQDLIDGVKWTLAHKYADPKRVCVYGGSFGGYSALMSVIRAPDMFQCAIGYDGVYDLDMLFSKSDTSKYQGGRNYLQMVLGDDEQALKANSPVDQVDKIDVPVFLIHGKDDVRAPYAGGVEMRDALQDAHKPVEWMAKSGEGHGFYNLDNVLELHQKMFAFLKKYIGPGAPMLNQSQASAKAPN